MNTMAARFGLSSFARNGISAVDSATVLLPRLMSVSSLGNMRGFEN